MSSISLIAIPDYKRANFLPLLLEADPAEQLINTYIKDGDLFSIRREQKIIGVSLFTFPEQGTVELKNIAIKKTIRNQGYGKAVIAQAETYYKEKGYRTMVVKTANSSIDNIAFYQKLGFRLMEIELDYFLSYPEAIYEQGIRARDRLVFIKNLT
ncbi:acetyltransferase (GNAT) family protein [Streptohalobacillus salinus]|uniref:Acetyltransferase (GNAT) family protein n=1 Tax=Streptohalobacillus salinus TaxID=621096 RepID=A0A2V3WJU1_9BACI|nr:GNAT family N-acetyltransferase [Streptohalobacillus salinus]PXW92938.1 acetyltransferase (GNAT) family protein [Streptohalobacillus salinus]